MAMSCVHHEYGRDHDFCSSSYSDHRREDDVRGKERQMDEAFDKRRDDERRINCEI
jgi:hypothetical protein